jgi:hypothetical protein
MEFCSKIVLVVKKGGDGAFFSEKFKRRIINGIIRIAVNLLSMFLLLAKPQG